MKKIILIVAMLYAMSFCGVVAYADNTAAYNGGDNTAIITDTSDFSTVLITKASDGSVVYMDQANGVFGTTMMDFLIKANPSVGLYNVKLGGGDVTTASTNFYIGVSSNDAGDTPMTRLSRTETFGGYYTAGFELVTSCSKFSDYNSIKVGYNNGTNNIYGGFPLNENWTPEVSGEGNIMLVFVLDHIDAAKLPTVSVFLSNDPLPGGSENVD